MTKKLFRSISQTARNAAKSLFAAISSCAWIKPFSTLWAFSFKNNSRPILIGAWNAAKFGVFTIKNRFKYFSAKWTFSLSNWFCSYACSGNTGTFITAKYLSRFTSIWKKWLFTLKTASFFNNCSQSFYMVKSRMFITLNNLKVYKPIVSFYPIFMVDYFMGIQNSIKMFCHYITMFMNLTLALKHWITKNIDKNITVGIKSFSALPIMMFLSFLRVPHGAPSICNGGYNK